MSTQTLAQLVDSFDPLYHRRLFVSDGGDPSEFDDAVKALKANTRAELAYQGDDLSGVVNDARSYTVGDVVMKQAAREMELDPELLKLILQAIELWANEGPVRDQV